MFRSPVRKFWTVSKGEVIGYAVSKHTSGFIFPTNGMQFCITSSNLSSSADTKVSVNTEHLTHQQLFNINEYMRNRTPFVVKFEEHVFGRPWKGDMIGDVRAISVQPLKDETIHVKPDVYSQAHESTSYSSPV